eukprot:scaffold394395_cov63-Attheya_sp.AAC.2
MLGDSNDAVVSDFSIGIAYNIPALAFLGSGTVRKYPIPELHSSGGCQAENLDIFEQGQNLSPTPTPAIDQGRPSLSIPVCLPGFAKASYLH